MSMSLEVGWGFGVCIEGESVQLLGGVNEGCVNGGSGHFKPRKEKSDGGRGRKKKNPCTSHLFALLKACSHGTQRDSKREWGRRRDWGLCGEAPLPSG